MWETWVQSLGQEDSLEKEMVTHSSTLTWKIPWMEEPGGLQSMGSQRVRHDWATSLQLLDPNWHLSAFRTTPVSDSRKEEGRRESCLWCSSSRGILWFHREFWTWEDPSGQSHIETRGLTLMPSTPQSLDKGSHKKRTRPWVNQFLLAERKSQGKTQLWAIGNRHSRSLREEVHLSPGR